MICNCTDPQPDTCAACAALDLPPLASILAVTTHLALRKAFTDGKVRVVPARGSFLVQSFTGNAWYIVTDEGCSCPARVPVCKHRRALTAIEAAWAHPSATTLPSVEETLERAAACIEQPVLLDLASKSRETVLREMDELFA